MFLVLGEQFGAQSGLSDVDKIFLEFSKVTGIVTSNLAKFLPSAVPGCAPTGNDVGRVDAHLDELFAFPEEFSSQNSNCSGSIADLLILGLRYVDKDLGGGIIHVH